MKTLLSIVLILFCFILNSTPSSNIIIASVLILIFLFNLRRYEFADISRSKYIAIFSLLISGVIGFLSGVTNESLLRYLCILLLLIGFPYNLNWQNLQSYYSLYLVGIFLVGLQLGSAFGLNMADNIITKFYPIEHNVWKVTSLESIWQVAGATPHFKRYGGIFYNPNIMGQTMALWYIILRNISVKSVWPPRVAFIIALISILFSGSRTAFFVFLIYNFLIYRNIVSTKFILSGTILVILLFLFINISSFTELRIFNFSQGITDNLGSINIKYEIFIRWLNDQFVPGNFNLKKVLFGNLSWDVHFDSDPGYLLNYFGFIGTCCFVYFLIDVYKSSALIGKYNYIILLIGLGATIIMNFRFSIILFLILSAGYQRIKVDLNKAP